MKTRKVNMEIALSRNFDKVTLGFQDEPIEFETEEQFLEEVGKRFRIIRGKINEEFKLIQKQNF